jgi:hypothetical protein
LRSVSGLVLLVPLRRKARAVFPSLEVVCAGGWPAQF